MDDRRRFSLGPHQHNVDQFRRRWHRMHLLEIVNRHDDNLFPLFDVLIFSSQYVGRIADFVQARRVMEQLQLSIIFLLCGFCRRQKLVARRSQERLARPPNPELLMVCPSPDHFVHEMEIQLGNGYRVNIFKIPPTTKNARKKTRLRQLFLCTWWRVAHIFTTRPFSFSQQHLSILESNTSTIT